MMYLKYLSLLLCLVFTGCSALHRPVKYNEHFEDNGLLQIHEGYLSRTTQRISYKREGRKSAIIELSEPIMVAQADRELPWGYYQFPKIGKTEDGTLIVTWQMKEDSHLTYGNASVVSYTPMMSIDGGKTWKPQNKEVKKYVRGYNAILNDGSVIQVVTPPTKDIKAYKGFPTAIVTKGAKAFYRVEELPEDFQGAYLALTHEDGRTEIIHAKLKDPQLVRYAIDGMMPVVWWGNIKELPDNSLVAGVYPTFYHDKKDDVTLGGVSFYKSLDKGKSWITLSRIPFIHDGVAESRGGDSFDEPAFEVLADGSFICVMRTGPSSPMYEIISHDKGVTWSTPKPFTPNGVNPQLMLLKNGVLVLASGRPGIQLRFSFDGTGNDWSDPIEMISFFNDEGVYTRDVSCGYASIIEGDNKNTFYLVYSDFTKKNELGENRKAIIFRKVTVKRR